jgi:soluble lytic murein transglycosylase-like protein
MFAAVRSSLWVRIAASSPAVCLVLLAACATGGSGGRATATLDDAPLHDAVAEWKADVAAYQSAPGPSARPGARRFALPYELPQMSLRPFSRSETARIRDLQPIVHAAASAHAVAPDLVNGIIWVESRFQVRARSSQSACGLMQLMPRTAREVARNIGRRYAPFDPEFNVHAGTYYFARMLERFDGNMILALAAYNIGPAVVARWLRDAAPLPSGSRSYVANVFEAARAFRSSTL